MTYPNANLGTDLLLVDGDLAVSNTGDLAATADGRQCLLQDIAHLLETLPTELWSHPDYGAGLPRLFGEEGRDIEARVARAVEDALTYSEAVAGRIVKGTPRVTAVRVDERSLEVRVTCDAIAGDLVTPLNFVWQWGLDDVSRISFA